MPSIPNARVLIVATDGFEEWELFGSSKEETQAFAAQCLTRRLKAVGLG